MKKEQPDTSILGFFIGLILGVIVGMALLLYSSTIPLGQ